MGTLHQLTLDMHAMSRFLGDSHSGSFFMDVIDARALEQVHLAAGASNRPDSLGKYGVAVMEASVTEMLESNVLGGQKCDEIIRQWVREGRLIQQDADVLPTTVLQLPYPFCWLVAAGRWPTIACNSNEKWDPNCHLHVRVRDWLTRLIQIVPEDRYDCNGNVLEHRKVRELSSAIRGWAAHFSIGSLDPAEDSEIAAEYVKWLDSLADSLESCRFAKASWKVQSGRGGYWNALVGEHGRYEPEFVVNCLYAMFDSMSYHSSEEEEDSADLKRLAHSCFKLLPAQLREGIANVVNDVPFPSRWVLGRARLFLDVAYMIQRRNQNEQFVQKTICGFHLGGLKPTGWPKLSIGRIFLDTR